MIQPDIGLAKATCHRGWQRIQMGRATSAPLASLSLLTPPVSPAGCAGLCLTLGPCPDSGHKAMWSSWRRWPGHAVGRDGREEPCQSGWEPVRDQIHEGRRSWRRSWRRRERNQRLVWKRAGIGWRLELSLCPSMCPCSSALRSEVVLGLLFATPTPAGSHPVQIQPQFLTATACEIKPGKAGFGTGVWMSP